jgi:hypothetical protein
VPGSARLFLPANAQQGWSVRPRFGIKRFRQERVLHQIGGLLDLVPFFGKRQDTCLIARKSQPFKQQRIDLSIEFACRPTGVDRFSLVKCACLRFSHPKEQPIVGPGQFSTQCVDFWEIEKSCSYLFHFAPYHGCGKRAETPKRCLIRRSSSYDHCFCRIPSCLTVSVTAPEGMRNVAAKRLAARWAVNGLSSKAFGFLLVSTSGSFLCIATARIRMLLSERTG